MIENFESRSILTNHRQMQKNARICRSLFFYICFNASFSQNTESRKIPNFFLILYIANYDFEFKFHYKNYIFKQTLCEMSSPPYNWQYTNVNLRGYSPSAEDKTWIGRQLLENCFKVKDASFS